MKLYSVEVVVTEGTHWFTTIAESRNSAEQTTLGYFLAKGYAERSGTPYVSSVEKLIVELSPTQAGGVIDEVWVEN